MKLKYFIAATYFFGAMFLLACGTEVPASPSSNGLLEAQSTQWIPLENGATFDLTASWVQKDFEGNQLSMMAYNEQIPGPILEVQQGDQITVNFHNDLGSDSTIHWHGIRLENAYDGVPGMTQEAVQDGESFTYVLSFPDPGIYWYHPHVNEDEGQERGLYGAILVQPAEPLSPVPGQEKVVFLDDILLQNGDFYPFDEDSVNHALMGRYGNFYFINGGEPIDWELNTGEILKLDLINASNARPFRISIPGAKIKLIGGDNAYAQQEEWVEEVILGPSERVVLELQFMEAGQYSILHEGGTVVELGNIEVVDETDFITLLTLQNHDLGISQEQIDAALSQAPDLELSIEMEMNGMGDMGGMDHMNHMDGTGNMNMMSSLGEDGIEWEDTMSSMNASSTQESVSWVFKDLETGLSGEDLHYSFSQDDFVKIHIENPENTMHPMQHPIHIHGQRFLVIAIDGVPNTSLMWKDTVLIPAGSSVDLLVEMSNPGEWMIHCHMPEHMESGLMTHFTVD